MLELDELYSFVGSELNPRWVWIALCRQTRRAVAYFVGDRSADSARALRERIPSNDRCRATRSDFWLADDEVFPRRTHRCTGKGEGQTCYVERWNNTLCQRLGRFVRRTLSFSKCERMRELALRLTVEGATNKEVFLTCLDHFLCPALCPGQVVIMDNFGRPQKRSRPHEDRGARLPHGVPAHLPPRLPPP